MTKKKGKKTILETILGVVTGLLYVFVVYQHSFCSAMYVLVTSYDYLVKSYIIDEGVLHTYLAAVAWATVM